MHHYRLGEDPQWALYRHRERLELTDPPEDAPLPRSHHMGSLRTFVAATVAALTIIAVIRADATPASRTRAPANLGDHGGAQAPQAPTAAAGTASTRPRHGLVESTADWRSHTTRKRH